MMRPRTDLISDVDHLQCLLSSPLGAAVIYLGKSKKKKKKQTKQILSDKVTTVKTLIAKHDFPWKLGFIETFFFSLWERTRQNTHTCRHTLDGH